MWICCALALLVVFCETTLSEPCVKVDQIDLKTFVDLIIPTLDGKYKGEAGKIGVIGGSTEYSGAPFFTAMAAMKAGADLAYVITTNSTSPIIKSYSPDLIVYPYLSNEFLDKIEILLNKMDVIIIGPGLGRNQEALTLITMIINICKKMKKPLIIDADGLYAISQNISLIEQYPAPGVILTPNHIEAKRLEINEELPTNITWYSALGNNVSVLFKGKIDQFHTIKINQSSNWDWELETGGSGRRVGGQGDILAGFLGTFYGWALKSKICLENGSPQVLQSLSAYAAAVLTRRCNLIAFQEQGRSMTASDMLTSVHRAFDHTF